MAWGLRSLTVLCLPAGLALFLWGAYCLKSPPGFWAAVLALVCFGLMGIGFAELAAIFKGFMVLQYDDQIIQYGLKKRRWEDVVEIRFYSTVYVNAVVGAAQEYERDLYIRTVRGGKTRELFIPVYHEFALAKNVFSPEQQSDYFRLFEFIEKRLRLEPGRFAAEYLAAGERKIAAYCSEDLTPPWAARILGGLVLIGLAALTLLSAVNNTDSMTFKGWVAGLLLAVMGLVVLEKQRGWRELLAIRAYFDKKRK